MLATRKQFILLCHYRSGSSALAEAMRSHPDIGKVVHEPFDKEPKPDMARLRQYLEQEAEASGFKLMMPDMDVEVFREWILKDRLPVVVLQRRNILRAVVSDLLGYRTHQWQKIHATEDYSRRKFAALPWEGIPQWIRSRRDLEQRYLDAVKDYPHLQVFYEDIYFHEGWKRRLPQIYQHCGYSPVITSKAEAIMKTWRLNNERVYLNIDNVYEIERNCGSNETGWLLNGSPLML